MILYTTLATLLAVALGLALNVARKQVRGLERELRKKTTLIFKYETNLLTLRSEVAGEKDKAKTWEGRGAECALNLQAALQHLHALEAKEDRRLKGQRDRKANQRAREKAAKQ